MNRKQKMGVCLAAAGAMMLIALALALPEEEPPLIPDAAFGMVLIDIADEEAAASYHVETLGVYVLVVEEKSPAFAAGVRSGDRLVSMNGIPVSSSIQFITLQEKLKPMQMVNIHFQRGLTEPPHSAQLMWNGNGK